MYITFYLHHDCTGIRGSLNAMNHSIDFCLLQGQKIKLALTYCNDTSWYTKIRRRWIIFRKFKFQPDVHYLHQLHLMVNNVHIAFLVTKAKKNIRSNQVKISTFLISDCNSINPKGSMILSEIGNYQVFAINVIRSISGDIRDIRTTMNTYAHRATACSLKQIFNPH